MSEKDKVLEEEGMFGFNLKRNAKQIREDRADAIIKKAEKKYRREIEDMLDEVESLETEQLGLIDLSPNKATDLMIANDFDDDAYVKKDIQIGMKKREILIEIDIAKEQYVKRFGTKAYKANLASRFETEDGGEE